MGKPTVGRIVHFVQNNVHYAAMVVAVHSEACVNLKVWGAGKYGPNPVPGAVDENGYAYSVTYNEAAGEWSWHWPERD